MSTNDELPRLLKMSDVADTLRISRAEAYRLCSSGQLQACRFGGKIVRVRQEDLDRFIQASLTGNDIKPKA